VTDIFLSDGGDLPGRSPLYFGPCSCGAANCPDAVKPSPDDEPEQPPVADEGDSPTLTRLRALVREDAARRSSGRVF
jgi:hypothetical protein